MCPARWLTTGGRYRSIWVSWATEVRLFGNEGAHPGDDGLADASEEAARDAAAFLDELLDWLDAMPEKLASAKSRAGHPTKPTLDGWGLVAYRETAPAATRRSGGKLPRG